MSQAHLFISGTVQGVGFRQFVKQHARNFGLTGYVRNTEDGGVEVVLQGDEKTIDHMIDYCKQGPFLAKVDHIGYEWEEEGEQFNEFSIH